MPLMCQGDGVNKYYVVVGADPGSKRDRAKKLGQRRSAKLSSWSYWIKL
jgi:hypothetical protein